MDALSETSLDSFVPYDQMPLFAAYEPDEWAEGTNTKPAPAGFSQFQKLREYIVERLIAGPVDELRDRISMLLRDDRYHELNSTLRDVIPITALINTVVEKKSGEFRMRDLGENHERYTRGIVLQVHVLASFLTFISSGNRELFHANHDKDVDRLAFMQQRLPVVIKRALLAMWIAPMLSVAVTAFEPGTPQSTQSALLDEWTNSLEQVLALFLALGVRATPVDGIAPEDLVPRERRIPISQVVSNWRQGIDRTIARMEEMRS